MTGAAPLSLSDRIRELNDNFRATFLGGRVVVTPAVRELQPEAHAALLEAGGLYSHLVGQQLGL